MQRKCGNWKALRKLRALWNTVRVTMGKGGWIFCSKLVEHLGRLRGTVKGLLALCGLRACREDLGSVKYLRALRSKMRGGVTLWKLVGIVEGQAT